MKITKSLIGKKVRKKDWPESDYFIPFLISRNDVAGNMVSYSKKKKRNYEYYDFHKTDDDWELYKIKENKK